MSPWRIVSIPVALALAAVGAIAASRVGFPLAFGAMAGAAAALLGVFALPSLSTRRVVVVLLGVGGLGALRHASFSGTDTGALLVCWAGATLVALLLVDRAASEQVQPLPHGAPLPSRAGEVARVAIATAVIAAVAVVAFGPMITDHLGRHVWPGVAPSFGDAISAPSSLRATDQIDMTQRPRLSDRVVFTVDAARPEFWRGQTFDEWDGSTWTQTRPQTTPLVRDGDTAQVAPDPYDAGAVGGTEMRQTFHVETPFSNVVFAAPSPVEVQTDKVVEERADGTLTVFSGFGKGATYTVTSRSLLPTAAVLRAADANAVPQADRAPVLPADARRDRAGPGARAPDHRARAHDLRQDPRDRGVARCAREVLDQRAARAEGRRRRRRLPVPVARRLVRAGREQPRGHGAHGRDPGAARDGIRARPARRAHGAVRRARARRARVGGDLLPRRRLAALRPDGVGPARGRRLLERLAVAGRAAPRARVRPARDRCSCSSCSVRRRSSRRRAAASTRRRAGWSTRTLARLERIGRKAGRPRVPAETPREYAAALAVHLHDDRVRTVGEVVDADGFSAAGAPASARADAEAVLSSLRP